MKSTSHAADKILSAVKAEMAVFEVNGTRARCVEAVYNYLLTVPPTYDDAECVSSFLTAHQRILGCLVPYNDVQDTAKRADITNINVKNEVYKKRL